MHARAYVVLSIEEVIFGFKDGLDRLSLSCSLLVCILRRQLMIAIFISERACERAFGFGRSPRSIPLI